MNADTKIPDKSVAFMEARHKLQTALDDEGAKEIVLSRDAAGALLNGRPPAPPLPDSWCDFDARFVPFLSSAPCEEGHLDSAAGITVTAHQDGGAVLAASNGHVLLLARDRTARVSKGGCRLIMPKGAIKACAPPPAVAFADQGDVFEMPAPAYMVPDRVLSSGASLMVIPKEQPPDPGRDERDGVMLWASMIETSNYWRFGRDSRRCEPFKWQCEAGHVAGEPGEGRVLVSGEVMQQVAAAMAAAPDVQYWELRRVDAQILVWLPAVEAEQTTHNPEMVIVVAQCSRLAPAYLPSWVVATSD